jgi:hypothetical protein
LEPNCEIFPIVPQLTGLLANIDTIYPEWPIESPNCQENVDIEEYVKYPTELNVSVHKSIRAVLNIDTTESKGTAKKVDTKKGVQPVIPDNLFELIQDDEGRALPRVFFADDGSIHSYYQPFKFKREYSNEQINRKSEQEQESLTEISIAALQISDSASGKEKKMGSAITPKKRAGSPNKTG